MSGTSIASLTFFEHGSAKLSALCDVFGFDGPTKQRSIDLLRTLMSPWGKEKIGERRRWTSDITDDHTPYEFSVAFGDSGPELRMLVEAQAPRAPSNLETLWEAGWTMSRELERSYGADLRRAREIADLFYPRDPSATFALWHATNMSKSGELDFKIYFNPQAQGKSASVATVERALERLGMSECRESLALQRNGRDDVRYFSLDLKAHEGARVKVYTAHHGVSAAEIERVMSAASSHVPGDAAEICRRVAGDEGPYTALPVQICLSFIQGSARPASATLYFPVRAYVSNDRVAKERILRCIDVDAGALYEKALHAFSSRQIEDHAGIQTYLSYRRHRGRRRMTMYLAPEAYRAAASAQAGCKSERPMVDSRSTDGSLSHGAYPQEACGT